MLGIDVEANRGNASCLAFLRSLVYDNLARIVRLGQASPSRRGVSRRRCRGSYSVTGGGPNDEHGND